VLLLGCRRYGNRGVQALSFCPSGAMLASLATDVNHSLFVWNVSNGSKVLEEVKSQAGSPPCVYGVVWSPFQQDR
jgi:WD40 repeat protein